MSEIVSYDIFDTYEGNEFISAVVNYNEAYDVFYNWLCTTDGECCFMYEPSEGSNASPAFEAQIRGALDAAWSDFWAEEDEEDDETE